MKYVVGWEYYGSLQRFKEYIATAIVKVTMDIASKVHVARYVKLFMMMMLILKNVPTHVLKPAIYSSSISKKGEFLIPLF